MPASRDTVERATRFAVRIIALVDALPNRTAAREIGRQLVRSGCSVGAHCREAKRARSRAEFVSKLKVAQQECDETTYWLMLISESRMLPANRLSDLRQEADELLAMLCAAGRTMDRIKAH